MLLPNELARRQGPGLIVRTDPLRLTWAFDDLAAADGHALRVRFSCGVRAVDDPTEKRMLQDVLLSARPALVGDDVVRYLAATLRSAAAAAAAEKGVEAWLSAAAAADKDALAATLAKAADRAAFACGLEILAPYQVDVESPSYEQKRLKDLQRALAEQEAAGRVEHFNRATELLKRFEEVREATPELTPGAILSRLSPVDQGATLQTLLLASARNARKQDLWAVGGEYLVKVDARPGEGQGGNGRVAANVAPRVEMFPLPPTLGPLRSVQPAHVEGEWLLLVGARDGFYLVRPDDPQNPEVYPDMGVESQLGFSRVVFHNRDRGFAACHGEAGLVRWTYTHTHGPSGVLRPERFGTRLLEPEPEPVGAASSGVVPPPLPGRPASGPPPIITSTHAVAPPPLSAWASAQATNGGSIQVPLRAPGPRNLQVLDDRRLLLSVAESLWVVDGDEANPLPSTGSGTDVVAIVPDGQLVHVVHEDGTIATLDARALAVVGTRRRPMRVRAAAGLPWLGSTRLLLAGDDGPVQCVGTDDPLVGEYASGHRGIRAIAASADLVAAVSADRQRLILWNTWDGARPLAEVYLTAQIRHRIADVEFC